MIPRELVQAILRRYQLPPGGTHGVGHWARVWENGQKLAAIAGARADVVELFAIFHDSQRRNEAIDRGHGRRGAALATELRGVAFELDDAGFGLLTRACELHTDGQLEGDVTLLACWDADRLDLGRVGIRPRASKLCTSAARDPKLLGWADERASRRLVPPWVSQRWGVTAA